MTFQKGCPPGPGRPVGRITKFRAALARVSNDGDDIAIGLAKIWNDPSVSTKDRVAAFELALAYMVGKPEATVTIEGSIGVGPRTIDLGSMLGALPDEVLDQMLEAAGKSRALAPGNVIDTEGEER